VVSEVLHSPGEPLAVETRAFMEPPLGSDLSDVRVHRDALSAQSASAVNALAYTVGRHVVFGRDLYAPETAEGKKLLAHELAHVAQQQGGHAPSLGGSLTISPASDPLERMADAAAERVVASEPAPLAPLHMPAPMLARKPAPTCATTFVKATGFKALIDLVRAAEAKLSAAGISSSDAQIKSLRSIYYGQLYSLDYKVEKSVVRNLGFETYTGSLFSSPKDPSTILDCGLFKALQDSQDVTDGGRQIDFGHLIIALDARNSSTSSLGFPGGGTGTEIVTWLGDLGGGAGSLAVERGAAPSTNVKKKFTGSDYGGSINLEGDVAGFVVGRSGFSPFASTVIPAGKGIADILQDYLSPGTTGKEWTERARTFLTMFGAIFASGALINRPAMVKKFASQIGSFACQYLASRLADKKITFPQFKAATDHVNPASEEVAETFVDALDDCQKTGAKLEAKRFPAVKPASPGACSTMLGAATLAGKAAEVAEEAAKKAEDAKDWVKKWF